MNLVLKVLSYKGEFFSAMDPVTIGPEGGSIGRSDTCSLVLSEDKTLSRHHADISFEHGNFYLTDLSQAGVLINYTPANKNSAQIIKAGDKLTIGDYEVSVSIQAFEDFKQPDQSNNKLEEDFLNQWIKRVEPPDDDKASNIEPNIFNPLIDNPVKSYPFGYSETKVKTEEVVDTYPPLGWDVSSTEDSFTEDSLFNDHGNPAPVETDVLTGKEPVKPEYVLEINKKPVAVISEPFPAINAGGSVDEIAAKLAKELKGIFGTTPVTPIKAADPFNIPGIETLSGFIGTNPPELPPFVPEPTGRIDDPQIYIPPEPPVALDPIPSESNLFHEFLNGAGIADQVQIAPEHHEQTLNLVGQIFRKLVDGTVELLRSRAEFKSLFRISGLTVIQRVENNPFNFLVTDDVLRLLLSGNQTSYMAGNAAIEESTNNLKEHQIAFQAGIQASIEDLLKTFDPKKVEKQFENGIVLQKKSKCWDKYSASYKNKVDYVIENIYGDAFVDAYERQIRQLKQQRKQNNK